MSSNQGSVECVAIVLRGWMKIGEIKDEFREEIKSYLPKNSEIIVPDLPMGTLSLADPRELCQQLDFQITEWVKKCSPDKVILIGFSTGTLLARGTVLEAIKNKREWLELLDRMVLIAGILRGWTVSSATPVIFRVFGGFVRLAAKFKSLLNYIKIGGDRVWKRALGELTERGEPFVVEQRLRFEVEMRNFPNVNIICLMGTEDKYVSPADVIEMGYRDNVYFIEITGGDHLTIIDSDKTKLYGDLEIKRKEKLHATFCGDKAQLKKYRLSPDHIDGYLDPFDLPHSFQRNNDTKNVVIILHGIRDQGFWTKRVATCIKGNQDTPIIRAPTPSYGYFSALEFIITFARYKKTRWFLEQYADLKALYPAAKFSFVGHSNGTYLAAHAMELCKEIRFKNIYFAGSVVRRDYSWNEKIESEQVKNVVNVFSSNDAVVATFPGFFEFLGFKKLNVGAAGYKGFYTEGLDKHVKNIGPFYGGHGAGISQKFWDEIKQFINTDVFNAPHSPDGPNRELLYFCYRLVLLIIVCGIIVFSLGATICFFYWLFKGVITVRLFLSMIGAFLLWWVLFRVARIF